MTKLRKLAFLLILFIPALPAHSMVTAAHPLATEAGVEILEAGGSAIDAAIAIQAVLTLVEPQSSGIGGGAFLLHYGSKEGRIQAFDGRETAPQAVQETHFLDTTGQPLKFLDAVPGGRSVGVPGVLRMLEMAHAEHGALPWHTLFEPAIRLANNGFTATPRLAEMLRLDLPLDAFEPMAGYFFPNGEPITAGTQIKNPTLAKTLTQIATDGADAFYEGELARAIVETVQRNGGLLTLDDMATYQAIERPAICREVAGSNVCSMPLPSSGGMSVLQILRLFEMASSVTPNPTPMLQAHLMLEASRLAFADRNEYLGDTDFVEVPVNTLLSENYLKQRANLISADKSLGIARPGLNADQARASGSKLINHSTSHFSVIDSSNNAVSMTSSIEMPFGSRLMVGGFLLNNQLTDFRFDPLAANGQPHPNRVQPGKRPLSSMSPVIALNSEGLPELVIGSPGGTRIIGFVAQRVASILIHNQPIEAAIQTGSFVNRNGKTELEADTTAAELAGALEELGHEITVQPLTSGLHGIERLSDGTMRGAADPRREGSVGQIQRQSPQE
ncbi:gamma-glutamyltransferase [Spiribacter sp. C176]|uniref:Glutathione hydrolase proenzyme n=1 Tax=Spiribacter salilacus TaxID=2664894 RepID=A0A6N7QM65_9GAMM|nr:gamma-glutamyltransferase [Spiribacter salilacus]MRH77142.1 gamma-glutamyltransferase [Spiribacter salilacus]